MENDINYYRLFGISSESRQIDILLAYKNKINKFNNINRFDNNQILEIKLMKKGLYILLNKKLKFKYDKMLSLNVEPINNVEPMPMNEDINESLDSVFQIDNSWMDQKKIKIDKKTDNNIIGDRIFSLSNLQKKPGYSTNDEIFLRNPSQGRVEKNI
jgi:hypothetical protein